MSKSQKHHPKKKQTRSAKVSFKALKTSYLLFFLGGVWLVLIVVSFAAIGILTNPKSVSEKPIKPTPIPSATVSPKQTNTEVPKIEKIPSSKPEKNAPTSVKPESKQSAPIWLVGIVVLSCAAGSWIVTQRLRYLALRRQVSKPKSVNKKKVLPPDPPLIETPLSPNFPLDQEPLPIPNKPIKLSEINLASPPEENTQFQSRSFEDSPIKFPPISNSKNFGSKLSEKLKINRSQGVSLDPEPSEDLSDYSSESSNYPSLPPAEETEDNLSPKLAVAPPERSVSLDVQEPQLTDLMDLRKQNLL